jgi:signal transduction histidine kinase
LALRRVVARRVLLVDALFAVLVGVGTLSGSVSAARSGAVSMDWLGYALVGVAVAALALRRRAPVLAFAVSFGAAMTFLALRYPFGPIVQVVGVTIYSVAAWRSARVSVPVCVVTLAVFVPVEVWGLRTAVTVADTAVTLAWSVLPWLLGVAARAYRVVRSRLTAAARQQVLDQERLRIAREVHDAVGHGLAVITMHAGIALHVLHAQQDLHTQQDAERVESSLRAIRDAGGQAMAELRGALDVLPDGRAAPGLEQVATLAKAVASERLSVDVVVDGEPDGVPAEVAAAGYRIVQESLTNVLRHADARHAVVRVCYESRAVRLTVVDDGRGVVAGDREGCGLAGGREGRGLAGMRDRARAVGGVVTAGPRDEGGFEVRAVLPCRASVGSL